MRKQNDDMIVWERRAYFLAGVAFGAMLMHIWLGGGIW